MKKLLAGLFVLGSVTALANVAEEANWCYTKACEAEAHFNVNVKIPKQLEISQIDDIDLGKWCGTKELKGSTKFEITGEPKASVDVKVLGKIPHAGYQEGELYFVSTAAHGVVFGGDIEVDAPDKIKANGKAKGTISATLNPLPYGFAAPSQWAGKTFTAKAKLVAKYDDSSWGL